MHVPKLASRMDLAMVLLRLMSSLSSQWQRSDDRGRRYYVRTYVHLHSPTRCEPQRTVPVHRITLKLIKAAVIRRSLTSVAVRNYVTSRVAWTTLRTYYATHVLRCTTLRTYYATLHWRELFNDRYCSTP